MPNWLDRLLCRLGFHDWMRQRTVADCEPYQTGYICTSCRTRGWQDGYFGDGRIHAAPRAGQ